MNPSIMKLAFSRGSMNKPCWTLLSNVAIVAGGATLEGPICVSEADLGGAVISDVDTCPSQDLAEIAARGGYDMVLVCEDWVNERGANLKIVSKFALARSSFNIVKIVLAVAKESGYRSAADLPTGAVVWTEYPETARKYFKSKGRDDIEVVQSYGDTESKIRLGVADAIVEIVETGSSLRQNQLIVIETIGTSKMVLAANTNSYADPVKGRAIRRFGRILTDCYRLMLYDDKRRQEG